MEPEREKNKWKDHWPDRYELQKVECEFCGTEGNAHHSAECPVVKASSPNEAYAEIVNLRKLCKSLNEQIRNSDNYRLASSLLSLKKTIGVVDPVYKNDIASRIKALENFESKAWDMINHNDKEIAVLKNK